MVKFQQFLNEEQLISEQEFQIQTLLFLAENLEMINESELSAEVILEGVNDKLNKLGLKIHKSKGILDYIKQFVGGIGKVFMYMIKGEHDKAKELLKSVKKEDVLDFLYKLDLGTLHLFTGPLHMIDAWTGWDLGVNLKAHVEKGEGMIHAVKTALDKVKKGVQELFNTNPAKQDKLNKYIQNLDAEIYGTNH